MNNYVQEKSSRSHHIFTLKKIRLLKKKKVNIKFLQTILGKKYLSKDSREIIKKYNLNYHQIYSKDKLKLNLEILDKLINNKFTIINKKRKIIWDRGWHENLISYNKNIRKLLPKYYRKSNNIFRIKGDIVFSKKFRFDSQLQEIIHLIVVKKYLQNIDNIYEFGSGSGNVITRLMLNLNKGLKFYCCDWSRVAISLLKKIVVKNKSLNVFLFNFFNPNKNIKIKNNSLILTNGALEQTGKNYKKFVKYLIDNKPNIVINFEPFIEFYNKKYINDYVLRLYIKKRKYLINFIDYLQRLEKTKKIKILDKKRIAGGPFQETFSFVVWKPI
jgi:SAM-dependent methyltransferase